MACLNDGQVARTIQDLIGRFTPTPLSVDLPVMQRSVRLETNSPVILKLMRRVLEDRGEGVQGKEVSSSAVFFWRLVCDPDASPESVSPQASIVCADGLRYASFGQSSFVAVDVAARQAVGFLAEQLTRDEAGFRETVLAALFSMTADALSLTAFRAMVARSGGKGILLVGMPSSDNQEFLNFAEESDFELLSGGTTFLERTSDGLQVWGGFPPNRVVALGCCVFVETEFDGSPRLNRLPPAGLAERLRPYVLFDDEGNFCAQRDGVLGALARSPAYRFAYDGDSAEAAMVLDRLLKYLPAEGTMA